MVDPKRVRRKAELLVDQSCGARNGLKTSQSMTEAKNTATSAVDMFLGMGAR